MGQEEPENDKLSVILQEWEGQKELFRNEKTDIFSLRVWKRIVDRSQKQRLSWRKDPNQELFHQMQTWQNRPSKPQTTPESKCNVAPETLSPLSKLVRNGWISGAVALGLAIGGVAGQIQARSDAERLYIQSLDPFLAASR